MSRRDVDGRVDDDRSSSGARTTTPRKDDAFEATYLVPSRRAVPCDAQVVEPTTATRRREGLLPRADDGPRANRALLIVVHPARPKLMGVVRTKRQKLTVCRENARAKGPKCSQVSSWKNHGRFRKSALRVCRDVRAGCVLTAPHTGPSTPRPRGHRERDAFARDAAARRDGRRAPGEADRLHQAELREKRRASQTSARGKLASTRVGEKRARRGDARGNHRLERGAAGSQRAVPIRRDVHHDPHRGRLCLRPLCTSRRRHATSAPSRKIRASSGCRNGRRLVPLACRLFFFFFTREDFFFSFRRELRERFRMNGSARRTEGLLSRRCVASFTSR